jgi:hypothetical protein
MLSVDTLKRERQRKAMFRLARAFCQPSRLKTFAILFALNQIQWHVGTVGLVGV